MPKPRRRALVVLASLVLPISVARAAGPPTPPPATAAAAPPAGGERAPAEAAAVKPTPEEEAKGPLRGIEYRSIGPAVGGRVARVTGVPGDPSTWYAATAQGGVWKSSNGGRDWSPVFDDQPVASIGSIAVAPSDPNVVWVGSGEANIRGNVEKGNGVYRSTDAGKTWSHVLTLAGQIGSMAVDPHDAGIAFAAVLGSPFGAGADRGVYRTTDGGRTWKKVLYVDDKTGASDVTLDAHNPRIVFAGMWQARRYPWDLQSGGPGSSLWMSHDGGDTWKRLTGSGLPDGIWGKVGVRIAPSDSSRVYAIIEATDGGLFRSDDGGASWQHVSASRGIRQRAWYYSCLTIDPRRSEVVWFPEVSMQKTVDAGEHIKVAKGGGWDHHDVWIDPTEPRRMIVASDAGVSMSSDGGETWFRPALPIAQLYHVATDTRTPYRVMAAAQDLGTVSGPSNSLHGGGIYTSDWHGVGGGEAGHVAADPSDPDVVYAGEYLGFISRYDERTGLAPHVGIYPDNGSGHGDADEKYRFQWTAPIMISPHDPKEVYHAANVLFRTTDGGQHWQAISPDLTRNDKSKQKWAGGPITGDNTGVEYYDTIFAIAESPLTKGVLWTGSDDGLVHVSRDDGAHWTNVTPKGMPEWGTVQSIEASRWDAGTAYVVADAHRLDDDRPYLWVTTDYGATWRALTAGLDARTWLRAVREDSVVRGLLYLASDRSVLLSRDAGASWLSLRLNLPTVAVSDLQVKGDDLVVSTSGRSLWILDGLGPVRQWSAPAKGAIARLFPPSPAVAWRYGQDPFGNDEGAASNPPPGATFTYWLASAAKQPVKLEVLDAQGKVVRTLSSELEPQPIPPGHPDASPTANPKPALSAEAGLHRATWDLGYQAPPFIPDARVDTGTPPTGPAVRAGDYTLRLVANGATETQPLRILPDPRITTARADQEAQLALLLRLRDRFTEIHDMVQAMRSVHDQLAARATQLAGNAKAAELIAASKQVNAHIDTIENAVFEPKAEVSYDILAGREGGAKLYSRYAWLYENTRSNPGPPTQGMVEVADQLDRELAEQRSAWAALQSGELARVGEMARALGLGFVVVGSGGS